jgi:hypothetical protein
MSTRRARSARGYPPFAEGDVRNWTDQTADDSSDFHFNTLIQ